MKRFHWLGVSLLGLLCMSPAKPDNSDWSLFSNKEDKKEEPQKSGLRSNQIMRVLIKKDSECRKLIKDTQLYADGWDSLPQPRFWSEVMTLDPEYSLVNIAEKREILGVISSKRYEYLGTAGQKAYKDSIRAANGLPPSEGIMVTGGKKKFYLIKETIPNISRAIDIFTQEGVDPWFAQIILMIESPGMNRVSEVGASGPFQIMPDVAREQGLIVNEQVDERTNFRKAAQTAAKLLRKTYIPKVRAMMANHHLSYSENDMWFRMLVLHSYHAGPGNVSGVLGAIRPYAGGVDLMKKVWTTEHGGFQNSCQNYSQLALAALMELDRILARDAMDVCEVTEQSF